MADRVSLRCEAIMKSAGRVGFKYRPLWQLLSIVLHSRGACIR